MNQLPNSVRSHQGFSLIELMIALAIVGILSAIAYPSFVSYIEKGRRSECRAGLLKSMQQEERYFTQRNKYVIFAAGSTTAVISAYSGENLARSACTIAATTCTAGTVEECIELVATPTYTESKVTEWRLNSSGQKQCKLIGSITLVSDTATCWP
jgi:type IV pilus assembly protein PilE